jgi:hypothetical protein
MSFSKNKLCFRTALQILLIISFHSRDQRKVRRKFNLSLLIHVSRNVKKQFFPLYVACAYVSAYKFCEKLCGTLAFIITCV